MAKHIFKYAINFPDEVGQVVEVLMPENFRICDVNHQEDCIFLWAIVDTHAELKPQKFIVYGTGWKIDDVSPGSQRFFLKTVHMPNGLVFHVFMVD